jgi:hypothetical protein
MLRHRTFRLVIAFLAAGWPALPALAQAPFLSYDFEDGSLGDFFNPTGLSAILYCEDGPIPSGMATAETGDVLMTNDGLLGICMLMLHPDTVAGSFPPTSRDYKVRVKVNLESVNELIVYIRGRIGVNGAGTQADSQYERGYTFALFPQGIDPLLTDGVLGLGEFTGCHELVEHPEWPGAAGGFDFARAAPGFPIVPGLEYWLEFTAQGDDDGGPVLLTGKVWEDGGSPPECAQLIAVDPDGLLHTQQTLNPNFEVQVGFGTSFDAGQQPSATARLDDLTLTQLSGCVSAPFTASRTLWDEKTFAQGQEVAIYEEGQDYTVSIAVADLRPAGACAAPAGASICERVPAGWVPSNPSAGGTVDGEVITWDLDLTGGAPASLTYTVAAGASSGLGPASFLGEIHEAGSDYTFIVGGEGMAASQASVVPVSDFGSIQHWLILGPFTREVGGAAPGDAELARDYLTDGTITQENVRPQAGDTVDPDYSGDAASTGLAADAFGRNPGGVPTWLEWRDYDDLDDRIDFEAVYGHIDEVMCHAVTYLDVSADTTVNFGVSSDDSVHILLDGVELHRNNAARGAEGRVYQDTPLTHPNLLGVELTEGKHILLVKVFEGGGENNFRVGFVDETGIEIPEGPADVTISLEPPPPPLEQIRRADADGNKSVDITDAVRILNVLFLGIGVITCADAADADDSGQVDITDAVRILNVLFLGIGVIPAPGTDACGADPTADALSACVYEC